MSFREVNEDILKELWEYRDQTEFAYMTKEDKKHMIYFDEITDKIIGNLFSNNLTNLMIIFVIMLAIGARNIIEMALLMVLE